MNRAKSKLDQAREYMQLPDGKLKGEGTYSNALEISPDYAKAHYYLAKLLRDSFDDFDGAKEHYLKAIEFDPFL